MSTGELSRFWRFLIILLLFLSFQAWLEPLFHSSPPILPAFLWHGEGWVELHSSIPLGSVGKSPLYGLVPEEDLPWFSEAPLDLRDLRTRYNTPQLIQAFSLSLRQPFLQEKHNLALAASYLQGTVINANSLFSLNKTLGPRTLARGYKEGPFYANGQLQGAIGGGVCKVATALYNLAVHCDLEIRERHAHTMPTLYIPPVGMLLCFGTKKIYAFSITKATL